MKKLGAQSPLSQESPNRRVARTRGSLPPRSPSSPPSQLHPSHFQVPRQSSFDDYSAFPWIQGQSYECWYKRKQKCTYHITPSIAGMPILELWITQTGDYYVKSLILSLLLQLSFSSFPLHTHTHTQNRWLGTSLEVQWFRLSASNAGNTGSIPGWVTKIPHVMQHSQNIKNKTKQKNKQMAIHQGKVKRSIPTCFWSQFVEGSPTGWDVIFRG